MKFLSEKQVEDLRDKYPAGTKIELIRMEDQHSKLQKGDIGTVTSVDDVGTIHMSWERGSSLGLIPGEDVFKKV